MAALLVFAVMWGAVTVVQGFAESFDGPGLGGGADFHGAPVIQVSGNSVVTFTAPTATWAADPGVSLPVTCAPASGSSFASGITMVNCSAVVPNTGGRTDYIVFPVVIAGGSAQGGLVPQLVQFNSAFLAGNTSAACGILKGFVRDVESQRNRGMLTQPLAKDMLDWATILVEQELLHC